MAVSGNSLVIVWRLMYENENKVHSFLITNLALGDLCMGLYLLIIATVGHQLPSELSVFTLTVITLERLLVIVFPFRVPRLSMTVTKVIMGIVWLCVVFLAALPLTDIHYFRNFYGRSGVCLALHITHEKPSGWQYSVFVFLVLNLASFSVIAGSYWGMYRAARTSSAAVRSDQQRRESNMARKMMVIVVTDAACWLPIIVLGMVSLAGVTIPPQVFAWVAVFVLPLNAAINPLLYTLSTAPFLTKARERALNVRSSFRWSLSRRQTNSSIATCGTGGEERTLVLIKPLDAFTHSPLLTSRGELTHTNNTTPPSPTHLHPHTHTYTPTSSSSSPHQHPHHIYTSKNTPSVKIYTPSSPQHTTPHPHHYTPLHLVTPLNHRYDFTTKNTEEDLSLKRRDDINRTLIVTSEQQRVVVVVVVMVVMVWVWGETPSSPFPLTTIRHQVTRRILSNQDNDNNNNNNNYHLPPDNLTQSYLMPLQVRQEPPLPPHTPHPSSSPLKIILLWNKFFGMDHYEFGLGREPFVSAGCPETRCWVTTNRSVLVHPDTHTLSHPDTHTLSHPDTHPPHALIWHTYDTDTSFPKYRSPTIPYIYFSMECPEILRRFGVDLTPYNNVFNWTFTYRRDSDVVLPYGEVMRLQHRDNSWDNIDFAQGKTKLAAWIASNCITTSRRESLVKELQEYIPVDTYGKCGTMGCGASRAWGCYQMINQDYKFYLAFENSLCRDYITEKVYNILELNVVPVVYGGVDYKRYLPPNSYIDVLDFTDVKALATHLSYLDSNTSAFNEYFKWKRDYTVVTRWGVRARGWCSLCQRLHHQQQQQQHPSSPSPPPPPPDLP
ncbi:hypothetical protein Pmani_039537 [Petrolisthes manimaculis]|uniref:Fucosyltransferase n=1 Tax=Petrolisthes manimaculis TaxID=1843537 RepID=A0AAE1TL90_9EUCA|nr:hypothetical protein Pmani_039537 [Petrolisthes manimaculis]